MPCLPMPLSNGVVIKEGVCTVTHSLNAYLVQVSYTVKHSHALWDENQPGSLPKVFARIFRHPNFFYKSCQSSLVTLAGAAYV